ncbi:hypothetical protein DBB_33890 [Desulfoluna spongiiphila]|nr:hypothetical protein DBB_33890 [Desulfoluna spongiiphila]
MNREMFLKEFLGALGAVDVLYKEVTEEHVRGTVIYDLDDPEEFQDFCWYQPENRTISTSIYNLACLLHVQDLLDIDKLRISRAELRGRYNDAWNSHLIQAEFDQIVDALEQVVVRMVDDGEDSDMYFIHE